MKLEQRRRVKCINHYWYVRDDFFYLGYEQRDRLSGLFHRNHNPRRTNQRDFLFARGWIHMTELSSIIVRNGGKLETFSTVFFFFLCEKNLTRKMTREWTKSKERNWSNSTFLSFFLFFFLFIKKITMKRLSFESKTIRLMETCRFNIPRHSSQSSIVREIKITGSA